ncbi:PREDICTED: uncharacterized protein LOC105361448 isoform X2 [Ceratosolen solmsi marchali]|uniref:Uncharacterized protein LOC105361448 isoform X2 n=1 Tax=Ceratosolen solmsi marchali TaxID=326594 RepID=A0AAJ6YF52_9HYME|nr:PREDICTED: uncharacterized protein LOC105361448 isoform X2 [Ceratosolen solmsi marchali]
MAEIGGASVFTNGNSGSRDLLQQAFQQVVDEDDQDNEFVAFLQNDASDAQVIQLTAEQAAALGITIKFDDQSSEANTTDFQNCRELEQSQQQSLSQEESQRIINELTESGLLKHNGDDTCATFDGYTQNAHNENYQQESIESSLTLKTIENFNQDEENIITEQTNNIVQVHINQTEDKLEQKASKNAENQCDRNFLQNTIQINISSANTQTNNSITESQAQILQRFPVILPSSQFIIKPAQTVLTPVKNIRILPNTTKTSNTIHTSQNSLLLPKTSLLNTISPQLIKAMPAGTQFLSTTNNISTQLLNTSQLFSKNCDNNDQEMNESLYAMENMNNAPALTQNLICQSTGKSVQSQIQQKGNLQQFFTPILKTTSNSQTSVKTMSLLNSNTIKQNATTSTIKSIQFPTQLLKTTYIKNPMVSLASSKNTSTSVIFRTAPAMKTDDSKSTSVSTSKIRTQSSNTPVSILKPQTKSINSILSKQNYTNTFIAQKNSIKQIEFSDTIKPLVTAKLKQSMNSIIKSIKKKIPQKQTITKLESDINKPLGSSENPIQIVQQGHTFHSMQRLTQSQLKQIAQVLHQRSQESSNPNEKVVYRLVFPDEMDLRMKSPSSLLKNRGGKRGRPKKNAIRPPILTNKLTPEEEQDDGKDERKKIVARTRSGRLSRPPRHMVRDYKHLHHLDFMQPDMDDSDGGYSDYNTSGGCINSNKLEEEDGIQRTELLAGLEVPKRKISDHFRCPTCSKIYLGRTRMARHFEMHPDHGSPDQLPPPTIEAELKQTPPQDPLKRKGKKRGPWAYVTPEAKSERRQMKLQEAISVCEGAEIAKIAGKPVVNSLSLFDLLILKSENNVRTFLTEIKELVERIREKTGTMLSAANNEDKLNDDVVDLNEELLCDVLALNSGFYRVNEALNIEEIDTEERNSNENFEMESSTEPPLKVQKSETVLEEAKDNLEERLSSGFSESSDLSVSDFLNERRIDSMSVNCPEVLSALTLMPRNNSSPVNDVSKVLTSGAEVETTDNPGFQKLNINISSTPNSSFMNEVTFTKLGENLDSSCTDVFTKLNGNYDQTKVDNLPRAFIKLEPTEEGFIKLENGIFGAFRQEIEGFGKIQSNGFHYVSSGVSDTFNNNKGFRKLVPKASTMTVLDNEDLKVINNNSVVEVDENSVQITTNSNNNNIESNIFETSNNLDITKITSYDIGHLDILDNTGVMDKNLMIDDKFVEHMELADNSNMVDEIVSERLKTMIPDNLLESNLLHGNGNLVTELDFEELSEEFNRNTRS